MERICPINFDNHVASSDVATQLLPTIQIEGIPTLQLTPPDSAFNPKEFAEKKRQEILAGRDIAAIAQAKRNEELAKGNIVPLGVISAAEKTIESNKKAARIVQQTMSVGVASMMASGCCGGHASTSNTSEGSKSGSNSHHDHEHCKKCDGELTNGVCMPCRRVSTSTITTAAATPIIQPLPPIDTPTRRQYIPPAPTRQVTSPESLVERAIREKRDIVLLFGAYVWRNPYI